MPDYVESILTDDEDIDGISSWELPEFPEYFVNYDTDSVLTSARFVESGDGNFVEYVDLDKPYKVAISSLKNYRRFLKLTPGEDEVCFDSSPDHFHDAAEEIVYDTSPDGANSENNLIDPEQKAKMEEEWRRELATTEEDIASLRMVLQSKVRQAQDLKQKLGITVWSEFRDDMEQGIKNVKESQAYYKTNTALKSASEKTTSVLGSFGSSMTRKIGDVKNSSTFKSFEEKVGSAYENVKSKVSTSRSSSTHSFEEMLNNTSGGKSSASTPTIHEEKPLL